MATLIVAGLLFIAGLFFFFLRSSAKTGAPLAVLAGTVCLLLSIAVGISALVQIVNPGERALVILFGEIDDNVLGEGWHFVNPMADIETIDCRVRRETEPQDAETVDTQTVEVTLLSNWRPDPDKLPEIWRKWGPDYAQRQLPLAYQEVLKSAVAKYKVSDLIKQRDALKTEVESELTSWLAEDGIIVEGIAIGDIDFSDAYDQAIEAKQVAEQRTLQAQNELERARKDAERAQATAAGEANAVIEQARGRADSAVLAAKGEAEALKVRAEAQADYNAKVSASLTPMLVQMEYLKTWNGALPATMLGGDTTALLPLGASR